MATYLRGAIDAWSNAGAAKALTTSYVAGTAFDSEGASELWLSWVSSGTVATAIELSIRWSDNGGSTYYPLPAVNNTASGEVDYDDIQLVGPGANGNHSFGPIPIPAGAKIQVWAQRDGGDATSAVIVKAHLVEI